MKLSSPTIQVWNLHIYYKENFHKRTDVFQVSVMTKLLHKHSIMYIDIHGYQYCGRTVLNYKAICLHHVNILRALINTLFLVFVQADGDGEAGNLLRIISHYSGQKSYINRCKVITCSHIK